MTTALLVLAAVLVAVLAYRLIKLPKALAVASSGQALSLGAPVDEKPEPSIYAVSLAKPLEERVAGDYYDPTTERVEMAFNEFGFITTPLPAPIDPKTGAVPMTKAEVEAMSPVAAIEPTP